jgi:hypothetical protein
MRAIRRAALLGSVGFCLAITTSESIAASFQICAALNLEGNLRVHQHRPTGNVGHLGFL